MGTVVLSPLLLLRLKNNNNNTFFSQRTFHLKPSYVPEDTEALWSHDITKSTTLHDVTSLIRVKNGALWLQSTRLKPTCRPTQRSADLSLFSPPPPLLYNTCSTSRSVHAPRSIMSGLNALLNSAASLTFPRWAVIIIIAGAPKWIVLITRRLRSAINTVIFFFFYVYVILSAPLV